MSNGERIAASLMRPLNPSIIIVLGLYTVLWGLWLISPFWAVFPQAALYSSMASVAAEWVWGGMAVFTGSITTCGAIRQRYSSLTVGAFAAALFWLVISIMYFLGDWHNTGGITALMLSIYAAIVWLNLKINKENFKSEFKFNKNILHHKKAHGKIQS